MNGWQLRPVEHVVNRFSSRKLAAFHLARMAGIGVPDDGVLLPSGVFENTAWSHADDELLLKLSALGDGRVVVRQIGSLSDKVRRAIALRVNDFFDLITSLPVETTLRSALYIQSFWPGNEKECARTVTVTIGVQNDQPAIMAGYQTSLDGTVTPFGPDDPNWGVVKNSCHRLWAALGFCAQAVFGLSKNSIVLLSFRRAFLPLAAQVTMASSQAGRSVASHGNAMFALADAVDAIGSQYETPDSNSSSEAILGRSIGDSWVSGRIAFSSKMQSEIIKVGDSAILVRHTLGSDDCGLFGSAAGVVSIADGVSSHYALLASSLHKPCLVDVAATRLQSCPAALVTDLTILKEGDWVTIDERQGLLFPGRATAAAEQVTLPPAVVEWANAARDDAVLVNCEDPESASAAFRLGADGIGLCRSERHLASSPSGLAALRMIMTSSDSTARDEATRALCKQLGTSLEELLAAVPGKPLSYRLLEPAEILAAIGPTDAGDETLLTPTTGVVSPEILRGAAFRNQFPSLYAAQINTAVRAAVNVAAQRCSTVELVIVVPMVSSIEEYLRWYHFINAAVADVRSPSKALVKIRVGVMIETPRAAVLAGQFARCADVFLIGTNDLTALVWGMNRASLAPGQANEMDPFSRFDANGVGQLLARGIREAREINPTLEISVCGSHASVKDDADLLLDTGASGLSCHVDAVPRVAVQLARRAERLKGRVHVGLPSKSTAAQGCESAFAAALESPLDAVSLDPRKDLAAVLDWAHEIANDLSLPWTGIWKFFKRDLVAHAFGPREARRFLPGWQLDDALAYALSLSSHFDQRIRYSVFPADIACRASSEVFPDPAEPDIWRDVLQRLEPEIAVEIFPQQKVNRTAFRAVLRDMLISIEGAPGQAIDIFWKAPRELSKFTYDGCTEKIRDFAGVGGFQDLFIPHLKTLFARSQALRDHLGVDWISLEGYAGPEVTDPIFIADLDLPLDGVLIGSASALGN